jgi:hypothetical protein
MGGASNYAAARLRRLRMKRSLVPLLALTILAAAVLPSGRSTAAASPWQGHWQTPFILGNPANVAAVDIRDVGRFFFVQLHDSIPAAAWNNAECHGPADAWGLGSLIDSTHIRVTFLWRCRSDGSFHLSTRYFESGLNAIAICEGATGPCSLVFSHLP